MQTEKMPVLQQVIFAVVSILLIALWVSHAGDHVIVAKLTVEKLVWGIVIWLLCLYLCTAEARPEGGCFAEGCLGGCELGDMDDRRGRPFVSCDLAVR